MRILISWTGSRREPYLIRAGALLPGSHLQLISHADWRGKFGKHYLLAVPDTVEDAGQIVEALGKIDGAPQTEVRVVHLLDPTDHNEVANALLPLIEEWAAEHEDDEFYVLLNTGTPQMQTVWALLITRGLFSAKIIQTTPDALAKQSGTPPVREIKFDVEGWKKAAGRNARRAR